MMLYWYSHGKNIYLFLVKLFTKLFIPTPSIHDWYGFEKNCSQSGFQVDLLRKSLIFVIIQNHFPAQDQFAFAPLLYVYVFNNITLLTLPLSLCLHVCLSLCLSLTLSSTGSTGQKETPPTKTGLCSRFHLISISSPPPPPPQCTL